MGILTLRKLCLPGGSLPSASEVPSGLQEGSLMPEVGRIMLFRLKTRREYFLMFFHINACILKSIQSFGTKCREVRTASAQLSVSLSPAVISTGSLVQFADIHWVPLCRSQCCLVLGARDSVVRSHPWTLSLWRLQPPGGYRQWARVWREKIPDTNSNACGKDGDETKGWDSVIEQKRDYLPFIKWSREVIPWRRGCYSLFNDYLTQLLLPPELGVTNITP